MPVGERVVRDMIRQPMRPLAIIFDMDGLMIDSEKYYREVQTEMGRKRGIALSPEVFGHMMGRTPIESLRVLKEDLGIDDTAEDLLAERTALMRDRMRHDVALMPGFTACLSAFDGKIRLGVATGSQREFFTIIIERFGLGRYFAATVTADEIVHGKPAPEIYLIAAQKLGVPTERCVVLEDAENGCVAAKRAGCYCIAVPSVWTGTQDFSMADYVAKDLFDAKAHIEQMMGLTDRAPRPQQHGTNGGSS